MKNILILIGIAIINFNALAQPNLNAVIEFEESTIDYGTIETYLTAEYHIKS